MHPEDFCDDCLMPNVVWCAPNKLWNRVIRAHGENGPDPMLCPTCFIKRAEAAGINSTAWRVTQENIHTRLERIEIEDTSDCATCEARHKSNFEMMSEVKFKCIGSAYCHECGRQYEAIAAFDD